MIASLSTTLSDRLNPIVVKELRQAVKSWFIVGVLLLLLSVLTLIQLLWVMSSTDLGSTTNDDGRDLFLVFQGTLLAIALLGLPIYTGVRLAAERASATSDLLYVTTIKPWSIVWGKLAAGVVVTLLVFAACAPFMIVTYLLRGIDPPTILFVLGLDFLLVLSGLVLAIFLGALPVGLGMKVFLGLGGVSILLWMFGMTTAAVSSSIVFAGVFADFADPDFLAGFVLTLVLWAAGLLLVLLMVVAMIAPPAADRARPLRLFVTALWIAGGLTALGFALHYEDGEVLLVWPLASAFVLLPAMLIAASERDAFGPRQRRAVPKRWLPRAVSFLFSSGAFSGLLWAATLSAVGLAAAYFGRSLMHSVAHAFDDDSDNWITLAVGVCGLFVLGYCLLATFLRQLLLKSPGKQMATGRHRRGDPRGGDARPAAAGLRARSAWLGPRRGVLAVPEPLRGLLPRRRGARAGVRPAAPGDLRRPRAPGLGAQRGLVPQAVEAVHAAARRRTATRGRGLRTRTPRRGGGVPCALISARRRHTRARPEGLGPVAGAAGAARPRAPAGERLGGQGVGSSVEFMDFREYAPGDDLRRLDWAAYARTDRLVTRLYREEVTPHCDLLVDASASMDLPGTAQGGGDAAGGGAAGGRGEAASRWSTRLFALDRPSGGGRSGREVPGGDARAGGAGRWPGFAAAGDRGAERVRGSGDGRAGRGRCGSSGRAVRVVVSDLLFEADPEAVAARFAEGAAGLAVVQLLAARDADPGGERIFAGDVRLVDRGGGRAAGGTARRRRAAGVPGRARGSHRPVGGRARRGWTPGW